nr:TrkA family potassium uptake protein [Maliibacterium massiliense]
MKKQFAIFGAGRFGFHVAKALADLGHEVLAIDEDAERVQSISEFVTHAVQADATDEKALKALGIRNFDVAVVTVASDIQASIMISLLCKELGVRTLVAKATSELHAKVLTRIGVDKIVFPERDMALRVAHQLVTSNILDVIELSPDFNVVEISPEPSWYRRTLRELDMRQRYGINIVAIKGADGTINMAPRGDDVVAEEDVLLCIGSNEDIRRLENGATN